MAEMKGKKARVEDVTHAPRAAMEGATVPSAEVTLLRDKKPCPGKYTELRIYWGQGKDKETALKNLKKKAGEADDLKCDQYACEGAHCTQDAELIFDVFYSDNTNKKSVKGKLHKKAKKNAEWTAFSFAIIGCFCDDEE